MKVKEILKDCSLWRPSKDADKVTPSVSVILPTFRRAKSCLFEAAVQSVLNQDFKSLELIIIDDASTDGTADLIDYFMSIDPRVSCIRHQFNVGLPAISEYEGYMKAKGEYIAFIFDDNAWERDFLDRTISFMKRNNAKASYGIVHGVESQLTSFGVTSDGGIGLNCLIAHNYIANGGVVLHREVIETVGLYAPHVALTRQCDWNLWKRIVKKYEFFETGITAGTEKGAAQNDSLGNSYEMNAWVTAECEAGIRDEQLLPINFPEYDITEQPKCCTPFYRCAVNSFYQKFSAKKWYQKEKQNLTGQESPLRVLVVAGVSAVGFNATTALSFEPFAGYSERYIFKYGVGARWSMTNDILMQADVVILVRDTSNLDQHKRLCKKLGIPCYLYNDDNFIELARSNKRDAVLRNLSATYCTENLNTYSGIIVSTKALKDYYEDRMVTVPIYVMEPCAAYPDKLARNVCGSSESITVAYMGGGFRDKVFRTTVMPALKALAKERPVRLVCPDRTGLANYKEDRDIEVIGIQPSLSLDLTLQRFSKYKPQYLIHCGPDIENNRYKTLNALMNATRLGAVLLASNVPPFRAPAEEEGACLCVENTPKAWFEALSDLASDEKRAAEIFSRAYQYCNAHLCCQNALAVLEEVLAKVKPASWYELVRRSELVIQSMVAAPMQQTPFDMPDGEYKLSRSLTEVPLSFTNGIPDTRIYKIRCNCDSFSELGICFSSYGYPCGELHVEIACDGIKVRECVLDMEQYVHDNWTYFRFESIEGALGKIFTITLKFVYDEHSALMGVFEDATKRTFWYKVFNKLGHPPKVIDLLFADCR